MNYGYDSVGVPGAYAHAWNGGQEDFVNSGTNSGSVQTGGSLQTNAPSFNVQAAQVSAAQAPLAQAQASQAQLQAVNPLLQQQYNAQLQQNNTDPFMGSLQKMAQGQYGPDDPSYQWRLQQGQQTAERSLAARGLLGSGNAAIELLQYGQGMASTEFGNQWNRLLAGSTGYQNMLSGAVGRLGTLAGIDLSQRQLNAQNNQFNAGQLNQVGIFNAGQSNQVGMFNAGQSNSVGMFNAGQQNQVNLAGANYGMQTWESSNRNALEQQRLQLEQTRQQTAAMAFGMDYQGQAYWDQQQAAYKANQGASSARAAFGSGQISQNSLSKNYSMESFGVNTNPSFGTPGWSTAYDPPLSNWGSTAYAQQSNDLGGGSAYGLGSYGIQQDGNSYGDGSGFIGGGE